MPARDAAADQPGHSGGATGTGSANGTGSGGTSATGGNAAAAGGVNGAVATGGTTGFAGGGGVETTPAGGRGGTTGSSGAARASGGAGGRVGLGGAGAGAGAGGGGVGGGAGAGQTAGRGGGGPAAGGAGSGGSGGSSGSSGMAGAGTGGHGAGGAHGGAGGVGGAPALQTGACVPPCALKFATNPNPPIPELKEGAILYVNLTTGAARVRDSASTAAAGETDIIQFSFDSTAGSNHGYHLSFTGGNVWDQWTEPYEYDTSVGMYSVKQFLPITMQVVETAANKLLLLTFYLVDHGVVIQSVRFPTCTSGEGVCRNDGDCPIVNSGSAGPVATNCDMTCAGGLSCASQCTATGAGLSLACSDCYARFFACSRTMCPGQFECPTPRLPGNGCQRCQVDKGCAQAFMTCSGLDHMPFGTLLLPLPN